MSASTNTYEHQLDLAARFLGAWNTHDVEQTVACYTPDVRYLDPNTKGHVEGADAMRRYLTKLFANWTMTWKLRELFPLTDDGSAVLWQATLAPAGSDKSVTIDGMDLVVLRGDLIARNEVYFDRAPLASLLG